ncbi:alpha/beta fold hydrolase [Bailinhaonella thermotolerans]|uniref:Alpha/beta hydrolase n=1 Tax=Bailinhaonella thermotolerans TaxID=1070861 RepID=A0A3A4B7L1_9ACTN|nr:alpha/beta hydrolase [Bailinhaonella thermotolerans]RJL33484.1 alpha/beta hydrolase [Bailinhaonella thermotolerans]
MSTPRFLTLPPGVLPRSIETPVGTFAALEASPASGATERWPALLVPGFTGSKEDFIAVLQTLAQSGRRVVAIDMRGQHESAGGAAPEAYTCEALGRDIAAIAGVFGDDPVHLVGHSFGGLVTREAVLGGGIEVASHTLMSSGPGAVGGRRATAGWALLERLPEMGVRRIWETAMEPEAVAAGIPEEIVAFLRRRMLNNCPTGLATMGHEVLTCPDKVAALAALELPTLVLCGENDDAWPTDVQAAMARRLNADCVVLPGAAHSPAVEAPETTAAALVRFWNEAERIAMTHPREDPLSQATPTL